MTAATAVCLWPRDATRQKNKEAVSGRKKKKKRLFVFRLSQLLFIFFCRVSPIKGAAGGFIYRRAAAAGQLNVLLMEQIMSKDFFSSLRLSFFLSARMKGRAGRKKGRERERQGGQGVGFGAGREGAQTSSDQPPPDFVSAPPLITGLVHRGPSSLGAFVFPAQLGSDQKSRR